MDNLKQIHRFSQYIEERLEENIDLDEAIRMTHISKFHFYRLFKAVAGLSVQEYVKRRRLSKAAESLRSSDVKILNVAVKYGFQSQEVFTRNFKAVFGCTPALFRKQSRLSPDECSRLVNTKMLNVDSIQLDIKASQGKVNVSERIERLQNRKFIGLERLSDDEQVYSIPETIDHFWHQAHRISNKRDERIYRMCYDIDISSEPVSFKELIAVEVTDLSFVPSGMTGKIIDNLHVVTYSHKGRILIEGKFNILETYHFIYGYRIPFLGHELTHTLLMETYGADFNGPDDDDSQMDISLSIRWPM